ncbi:hypothetical protein ACQ4LE_004522 [Meloidogyne hapla]
MNPAPVNLNGAITYLKTRFERENSKVMARQKLSSCRQYPGESVFDFSNRISDLVRTALVGETENTIKNSLLYEFLDRLDPDLKFHVKSQRPTEYNSAYELALNFELLLAEQKPASSVYTSQLEDKFEALSLQRNNYTKNKTCFNCRSPNHLVRDCPEKKSENYKRKPSYRSRTYYNRKYGNKFDNSDQWRFRKENEKDYENRVCKYSYTRYRDYDEDDNRSWRRNVRKDYDNLSESSSSRSSSRENSNRGFNRNLSPQFRRGSPRIWVTSPEY